MTNQVITFGCRLNFYESQAIKDALHQSSQNNLIVFNSCAVTCESERQLRQSIRKAARRNPLAKIIVTGCAAQINPQKYANMKEVSLVLGNEEKYKTENYLLNNKSIDKRLAANMKKAAENMTNSAPNSTTNNGNDNDNNSRTHKDKIFLQTKQKEAQSNAFFDYNIQAKIVVNDIMSVKEINPHLISSFGSRHRAFVQIQNGCNHRCTFCIIPYGRGNSRSVAFGQIVQQVQKLVASGYKEIVLTGVDITDYGKDLISSLTFSQMIKRLLKLVPELPRLRISSIDVAEVDNDHDFFDLIANQARFMPHLHISLQSGDDIILKRMARRHKRQQVTDFCSKVRKLRDNVTFGSDIIAGFPTENAQMFKNTLNLILENGIIFNHIFPYSIRAGTPAAKMPQIPTAIKKQRAKLLRQAGEVELHKFLDSQIGTKQKVILENDNSGRCENFITTKIITNKNLKNGDIFEVLIKSKMADSLIAELI